MAAFSLILALLALIVSGFTIAIVMSGNTINITIRQSPDRSKNPNFERSSTENHGEVKSETVERAIVPDAKPQTQVLADEIPKGTKFIVQSIPYPSKIQIARDMQCRSEPLGAAINGDSNAPTIDEFIDNLNKPNNRERFQNSEHYRKVVDKFGVYPPPTYVKTLVVCEAPISKGDEGSPDNGSAVSSSPIPRDDEIPEGTKFLVQGIPYKSYAQGARDMNCDGAYFRDCITFKPGNRHGTYFEVFMKNRVVKKDTREKFMGSTHYKKVVEKYGSYPPPNDVELLKFI